MMSNIVFPEYRYVCVSTSHITEQDSLLLDDVAKLCEDRKPTVYSYVYGYWVYVGNLNPDTVTEEEIEIELEEIRSAGYSEAFVTLLKEAGKAGLVFVCLDADGDYINGLETFEW